MKKAKVKLLVCIYVEVAKKKICWFVDSAENHIETVFAGLYAKNVQRKLLVSMCTKKAKVKLLVCIYAVKAKTKVLVCG